MVVEQVYLLAFKKIHRECLIKKVMEMNHYITSLFWCTIGLMFLLGTTNRTYAQNCGNAYLNSSDPNTIEYDNIVAGYHSMMLREYDGRVLVWGDGAGPRSESIASPITLNGNNYGSGVHQLRGTILRFTLGGGAPQFAVLTTEGLYVWGYNGNLISELIYSESNKSFKKVSIGTYNVNNGAVKADGLPYGVKPEDVKMMFGATQVLVVVTYEGQAWSLIRTGGSGFYGDGTQSTNQNDAVWHRVSTAPNTPLENVVAVRGSSSALMALTAEGGIYTWGMATYLGNNTDATNRVYATAMVKPSGITPKMIGLTYSSGKSSYYLLCTNGRLYTLGGNYDGQLGDNGVLPQSSSWYQVSATRIIGGITYSLGDNIAWISPNEHYVSSPEVNVLTVDGKLWRWGVNSYSSILGKAVKLMYSASTSGGITENHPLTLNINDRVIAVETGGDNALIIKQCQARFGFIGHKRDGNMSDNLLSQFLNEYSFNGTAGVRVCGAMSQLMLDDQKICMGTTFNLDDAVPRFLPLGSTRVNWWMNATGTIPVANPQAVEPGIYYGTFGGSSINCPNPTPVRVSYYSAADPKFKDCESHFITNPLVRQLMQKETESVEKRDQFISR